MSPNDFDNLAAEYPQLRATFALIKGWASERHGDLDTRVLRSYLPDADAAALALSLHLLVQNGVFRRVYKVVAPSGVLTDADYDDPRDVPERVPDRFNNYFEITEGDVVPVLRPTRA
jgi:hypothetical protein